MAYSSSVSRKLFVLCNNTFLIALSILCLLPIVHVLALSFSSNAAATSGLVSFWPVDFTLSSYEYVMRKPEFIQSFVVTLERVVLGTSINMLLVILVAYPLSKTKSAFGLRTGYAWYFVFTMLFSGGLIPLYMTVKITGLLGTIWSLIFPPWGMGANIFNVLLLLNFFRGLPKELEEAAFMEQASHWTILWKIYIPLSKPAIATICLFTMVFNWNAWFDGLIFMNNPADYPLSTYLQTILINHDPTATNFMEDMKLLEEVSDRTAKAAQIFLGALPILAVYPFLQKYFMKGIVLGSVKE